jgi:high affinity sulfate transporter 1
VVAGLTVGAMLVPQSMAYAELAGAPAVIGLHAVVLAPIAYALVGTSRHLGTGPEPGTAILAGTAVAAVTGGSVADPRGTALLALLALLVAALAAGARLLRVGFIANLLSRPVLVGYISGVGIVLLGSQLGAATGVPITAGDLAGRVAGLVTGLGEVRAGTVGLFVLGLTVSLAARRARATLPGALLAVGLVTLVSIVLDLPAGGEPTVGTIPAGLPPLGLPTVGLGDVGALLTAALGITLVGYTDNVLTARSIADAAGHRIDADRELGGLAAANLAAGLTGGMPVSSSASRTAVGASSGGNTALMALLASSMVVATLLFARGLLAVVPRAALAAVIVAAALVIIDVAGFRALWRVSRIEFALAATTAAGVVAFDVLVGVLLAVGLSAGIALGRLARPEDTVLGEREDLDGWVALDRGPGARTLPGLLVYRFDAPLLFLNAERFRERLLTVLEQNPGRERWIVLDLEGVGEVDTTAVAVLAELVADLRAEGVEVLAVARANRRTLDRLERGELLAPTGPLVVHDTINAAVAAFEASHDADA